jgi:hypothetical protein
MRFATKVVAMTIGMAASLALAGCAPTVADGARAVFSTSQICRADAITIRARPDLAPHAVLKGVTPPPGVDLDAVGDTYELAGCNRKVLLVCGRPVVGNHADPFSAAISQGEYGTELTLNTEYFALTRALDVDGNRVASAVVCQTANSTVQ